MKTEDTRLTAFALDELPAADRADIERMIRQDATAAAEVAATREMAGLLKKTLHAEEGAPLLDRQRDAIYRAAADAIRGTAANERNVLTHPAWWNRVGVWQTIAACAVFGFGVYAITNELTRPGRTQETIARDNGDIRVGVPQGNPLVTNANGGVDTSVPPEKIASNAQPIVPNVNANASTGPGNVRVTPSVPLPNNVPPSIVNVPVQPSVIPSPEEADPDSARAPIKGMTPQQMAAAVRATSDKRTNDTVETRLSEAAKFQQGNTYEEFAKIFRADATQQGRYEMQRMPVIKVDAKFTDAAGAETTSPAADAKVSWISKPYVSAKGK